MRQGVNMTVGQAVSMIVLGTLFSTMVLSKIMKRETTTIHQTTTTNTKLPAPNYSTESEQDPDNWWLRGERPYGEAG
jgi:hypothetical protein